MSNGIGQYTDPTYNVVSYIPVGFNIDLGISGGTNVFGLQRIPTLPKFSRRTKVSAVRFRCASPPNSELTNLTARFYNRGSRFATVTLTGASTDDIIDAIISEDSAQNVFQSETQPEVYITGTATGASDSLGSFDIWFEFEEKYDRDTQALSGTYDYFVDSIHGNDSNDGRTSATAYATLTQAKAAAIFHGDGVRIGLARGSEWREELDLSTLDGVTVAAYGSGKLPIIRGDDVLESGDFTNDVTHTNTWRVSWTPTDNVPGVAPNVFVDGVRLARAVSAAACNSTAGSYYANNSYTPDVAQDVYIHPPSSTNPTTDGKTYEITRRDYALKVGGSCSIVNIKAMRASSYQGNIVAGLDTYVSGCVSLDGSKHGIYIESGLAEDTFMVRGDDWFDIWGGTTHTPAITYTSQGAGHAMTWRRCVILNNPDTFGGNTGGFYTHGVATDAYDSMLYEDCQVYYAYSAFRCADTAQITVRRCLGYEVASFTGRVSAREVTDYTCEDSEVFRQVVSGVASLDARVFQKARGSVVVRRMRAVFPNQAFVYHAGSESISVEVTDSIIATRNSEGAGIAGIGLSQASGAATVNLINRRNVFDGLGTLGAAPGSNRNYSIGSGATISTLESEDNIFADAGDNFELSGSIYSSVAFYKAGQPTLDVNSVAAAPGFAGDIAARDYTYAGGSAAVALGAGQVDEFQHEGDYAALLAEALAL